MSQDLIKTENQPPNASMNDSSDWELATLWRRGWRVVKWAAAGLLALAFVTVIGQGFLYYQMIAAVSPWLGLGFVVLLASLMILLVGRPLLAFFNTPVAAEPPHIEVNPKAPAKYAIIARLNYDRKFLKALRRHPDLAAESARIDQASEALQALLSEVRAAEQTTDPALLESVLEFEAQHIEPLLKPLDDKVDKLIHGEAVGIGVATAVSMNGTVDAFIVLWRSANLIAKISRIYFGRPNLRGSLLVMRDVAAIVVMSRALEDVTDMTGDLIGSVLGRMGGLVAGPVVDGAVNAMMALKLGYLTKRRCRAYRGWSEAQAKSISAEALALVKKESASVINELIKAVGGLTGAAASAAETVMTGSKNTWATIQSWFGKKEEKPESAG